MGNKATARRLMADAGLPLLPGVVEPVRTVDEGRGIADRIGYPVIIKAAAGRGGPGVTGGTAPGGFAEGVTTAPATVRALFPHPALHGQRVPACARHSAVAGPLGQ